MSLLDDAYELFYHLDKTTAPDGMGGTMAVYQRGASFQAVATYNNSMESKIGAAQGVTSLYNITTKRNVNLQYHDAVERARDGKIFRVTSDGDDNVTPPSAGLDMRVVSAEEWKIPTTNNNK